MLATILPPTVISLTSQWQTLLKCKTSICKSFCLIFGVADIVVSRLGQQMLEPDAGSLQSYNTPLLGISSPKAATVDDSSLGKSGEKEDQEIRVPPWLAYGNRPWCSDGRYCPNHQYCIDCLGVTPLRAGRWSWDHSRRKL